MRVLFVGAHVDDIEMGASGLLVKMLSKNEECHVIVFSRCEDQPGNKGVSKEFYESMSVLGVKNPKLMDLPNTKLPQKSEKIRKILDKEKTTFNPDIVVTHDTSTLHQDHKAVTEECLRVFRNSSILMYEDIKSVEHFAPNLIVSLTAEEFNKKIEAVGKYKTQTKRYYYDPEILKSLAKIRGKQMNVDFGEGYRIHRSVFK